LEIKLVNASASLFFKELTIWSTIDNSSSEYPKAIPKLANPLPATPTPAPNS